MASSFDQEVSEMRAWFESPRFAGIKRLYSAREVVEQRGMIRPDYTVAREAAEGFYARLRQLFNEKKCITTFGPYSFAHLCCDEFLRFLLNFIFLRCLAFLRL